MKKLDWKKVFALILVLALAVTVFAACGKDEEVDPGTTDPTHTHTYATTWSSNSTQHWHAATCAHTKEKADVANHTFGEWVKGSTEQTRTCSVCGYVQKEAIDTKQEAIDVFVNKMFASADQIGKNTVVTKDGTTYVKLGIGLDLCIEKGAKITSANALNLDIIAELLIDHKNVESYEVTEKDANENDVKVTKYKATAENNSAARVTIKEGDVVLIGAYYDYTFTDNGVIYLTLGNNKIAIDMSDIDADVANIENVVIDALVGVLGNEKVGAIAKLFGDNFTLNGFLNEVLKVAGLDLKQLLSGDIGNTISSILGMTVDEIVGADGTVQLDGILKGAGALLFNHPTWNGEAIVAGTTDLTKAGTAEIGIALDGDTLGLVVGGIPFLQGAKVALGFTKLADTATAAGKIDSFYIDAFLSELGESKKDVALRITIEDLVLAETGFVRETEATMAAAYSQTLKMKAQLAIEIPENFVELKFDEDKYMIAGGAVGTTGVTVPKEILVDLALELDFANAANTRLNLVAKADDAVVAKAHLYYDATGKYGIAEADVDPCYMKIVSMIYTAITTHDDFGWFMPSSTAEVADGTHKYSATTKKWYNLDDTSAPADAYKTKKVTLVEGGLDYTDINAAMKTFQTTGNLKATGIDLYKILFPGEGNVVYANYKAAVAAAEETTWSSAVNWQKKESGIFGIIGDMINLSINANSELTLKIGAADVMGKLFDKNSLFTVTDPDGQEYYDGENEFTNLEQLLWFWSAEKDADGKYVAKDWTELEAHWTAVLADINKYINKGDATVTELTVKDIKEADAFVTISTKMTNGKMSDLGLKVEVTYAGKPISIGLNLQIVDSFTATDFAEPYDFGDEAVGTINITLRDKDGEVWPTPATPAA